VGNVEKSKSLWESALFADFHRDGIFHRPMTLVPKIHPLNPGSVAAAAALAAAVGKAGVSVRP